MDGGDLREQPITAMTDLLGLQRHIPAPLLLVQAAEEQVHLSMQFLIRILARLTAIRTSALVYFRFCHFSVPLFESDPIVLLKTRSYWWMTSKYLIVEQSSGKPSSQMGYRFAVARTKSLGITAGYVPTCDDDVGPGFLGASEHIWDQFGWVL